MMQVIYIGREKRRGCSQIDVQGRDCRPSNCQSGYLIRADEVHGFSWKSDPQDILEGDLARYVCDDMDWKPELIQ